MTTTDIPDPDRWVVPDTIAELTAEAHPAPTGSNPRETVTEAPPAEQPAPVAEAVPLDQGSAPLDEDPVEEQATSPWLAMSNARFGTVLAIFAVTISVVSAAFALSFDAISTVGGMAGITESITWLMPVCIDGAIIVGTVAWVWKHVNGRGWRALIYPVVVVLAGTAMSIWLNALHAQHFHAGAASLEPLGEHTAMIVAAAPAAFLAVIVHLVADLVSDLIPRPADERAPAESAQLNAATSEHDPERRPERHDEPAASTEPTTVRVAERASAEHVIEQTPVAKPSIPAEQTPGRQAVRAPSAKPGSAPGTKASIPPKARRWITEQIQAGTVPSGGAVGKRYGVHETTGRRWVREIQAELNPTSKEN